MKKTFLLTAICLAMFGLSGCVRHELSLAHTTDISTVDFGATRFKKGTSCANYLFPFIFGGLPLGGEDRFLDAVQDGRISRVKFAENRETSYIVFGQRCIDVYGL